MSEAIAAWLVIVHMDAGEHRSAFKDKESADAAAARWRKRGCLVQVFFYNGANL